MSRYCLHVAVRLPVDLSIVETDLAPAKLRCPRQPPTAVGRFSLRSTDVARKILPRTYFLLDCNHHHYHKGDKGRLHPMESNQLAKIAWTGLGRRNPIPSSIADSEMRGKAGCFVYSIL